MKFTYRHLTLCIVITAIVLFIAVNPYLRQNNPAVEPTITSALLQQAQIDFDAPALELITWPYYRVVNFSGSSGQVAVYSRLGFRIATMTINECKRSGNSVLCGGDKVDYGIGW